MVNPAIIRPKTWVKHLVPEVEAVHNVHLAKLVLHIRKSLKVLVGDVIWWCYLEMCCLENTSELTQEIEIDILMSTMCTLQNWSYKKVSEGVLWWCDMIVLLFQACLKNMPFKACAANKTQKSYELTQETNIDLLIFTAVNPKNALIFWSAENVLIYWFSPLSAWECSTALPDARPPCNIDKFVNQWFWFCVDCSKLMPAC